MIWSVLTDLAPTFLELAGVQHPSEVTGEYPMIGVSLENILLTGGSGIIDPEREAVYSGRERHSSSRWNNLTYPQRAVRTHQYLYIKNFKPERWPAGAPEKLTEEGELAPGYHDIDNFTESYIYINRDLPEVKKYFDWVVAKRPLEELYDIRSDPGCLKNLALDPEFEKVLIDHRNRLQSRLEQTKDPRVMGNGDIWEDYVRYSPIRQFPEPDWKTN
jgi:N-sulfoglucosamine sulfohydrolase